MDGLRYPAVVRSRRKHFRGADVPGGADNVIKSPRKGSRSGRGAFLMGVRPRPACLPMPSSLSFALGA